MTWIIRARSRPVQDACFLLFLSGRQSLMCTRAWHSVPEEEGATGRKETTHGRQAIDGSPRMRVADELLHLLRRDADTGASLYPSLRSGPGPRRGMGMRLAGMSTPVGDRARSLHVSRWNRHRRDGAPTVAVGEPTVADPKGPQARKTMTTRVGRVQRG